MMQDKRDNIWYATQNGLICYDGYEMKRFVNRYDDENTVSGNFVIGLAEDRTGKIWISTAQDGLNRYDPVKKRITRFRHQPGDNSTIASNALMQLCMDSRNRLWIGYVDSGWSVYDLGTGVMRHYRAKTTIRTGYGNDAANTIERFCEDGSGGMWIASSYGLHHHEANDNITTYADSGGRRNINDNLFISILKGDDTTIWLGTWGEGLKKFNTRTKHFTRHVYEPPRLDASVNDIVMCIAKKSATELWVGTADKGLATFDMITGTFTFFPHNPEDQGSPLPAECFNVMVDRSGILWAAFYSGISRFTPASATLHHHRIKGSSDIADKHIAAFAFYKDTVLGALYLGCLDRDGLTIIDERTGQERVVKFPRTGRNGKRPLGVYITDIFRHSDSSLLLSSSYGLCIYNMLTGTIREIQVKDQESKYVEAANLVPAPGGGYWANSWPTNGFYYIDQTLTKAIHYYYGHRSPAHLPFARMSVMCPESDTLVWLTTLNKGLFRLNPLTGKLSQPAGLASPALFVQGMLKAGAGEYWAASEQYGVFHIKVQANGAYTLRQFTEADGLASDRTHGLCIDPKGRVVVLTEKGPSVINKRGSSFFSFQRNGLIRNIFEGYSSLYCAPDGDMYMGMNREYIRWNPDSLATSVKPPVVQLRSIRVFDSYYHDTTDLGGLQSINLPYDSNSLNVSFIAIDHTAPKAMRYMYKLDGINSEWVDAGDMHTLTFTRLPHGSYVLRIKAISGMGVASANELQLAIVIAPPFWKTWWFVSLCILAGAGVVALVFRIRVARIRREEAVKTQFSKMMAEVEMKALRAQMNPHFLFNCLNSINRYILSNDPQKASGYLTRFSKLIRLILDTSAAETTTLDNEIGLLRLYVEMEMMRFDGKFTYSVEVDPSLRPETISVPTMIIQPYVENAIWHGLLNKTGGGHVRLVFSALGNDGLEVIVEDSGVGRARAAELKSKGGLKHKSFGMQITNDRIKAMNHLYDAGATVDIQDLYDAEGHPAGTRVRLKIPLRMVSMQVENT